MPTTRRATATSGWRGRAGRFALACAAAGCQLATACDDSTADNYQPLGGSGGRCFYAPTLYCSHSAATNYNASPAAASVDAPWLCTFAVHGCTNPTADNYVSLATVSEPGMWVLRS